MKKLIYTLFVLIALPMAWSCEKEELADRLDGIHKYYDSFRDTKWISVSEDDSIYIEFECYNDTSFSSICICFYDRENGVNKFRNWEFFKEVSILKNKLRFIEYASKGNDKEYSFDINGDKLTLYNFNNDKDYIFYREYRENNYLDGNIISGVWNVNMHLDSVVLVFENKMMKEYIFEKKTGKVLKYTDYDSYSLVKKIFTWRNSTKTEDKLWIYSKEKIEGIYPYKLENDKLTIYKNEPIVYTKIESYNYH